MGVKNSTPAMCGTFAPRWVATGPVPEVQAVTARILELAWDARAVTSPAARPQKPSTYCLTVHDPRIDRQGRRSIQLDAVLVSLAIFRFAVTTESCAQRPFWMTWD